jgi:hypothetical protein
MNELHPSPSIRGAWWRSERCCKLLIRSTLGIRSWLGVAGELLSYHRAFVRILDIVCVITF